MTSGSMPSAVTASAGAEGTMSDSLAAMAVFVA
jgi:hypothetical protein